MPPIQQLNLPWVAGQLCVKSAANAKLAFFTVKMAGYYPHNSEYSLPKSQGCTCLFNAKTGQLDSLFVDNGLLTQLRTAISGAVAAKWLAPKELLHVAVIGAGEQAGLQLDALRLVRDFNSVKIYSRDYQKAAVFAQSLEQQWQISAQAYENVADAVSPANLIITTTAATSPILLGEHIHVDQAIHITAIGSDAPNKVELSPELYLRSDKFVCDKKSQSLTLGELRAVEESGGGDFTAVQEIGSICSNQTGRETTDKLTICDLTGVGVLDLAIAMHAKTLLDNLA